MSAAIPLPKFTSVGEVFSLQKSSLQHRLRQMSQLFLNVTNREGENELLIDVEEILTQVNPLL